MGKEQKLTFFVSSLPSSSGARSLFFQTAKDLLSSPNHRERKSGEACDMYPIALIGSSSYDFMQKDNSFV
jgi:hypothetical protein